ncbi:MAG: DUF1214 domain-containing protein [Casimicrobiaceae bacterium]
MNPSERHGDMDSKHEASAPTLMTRRDALALSAAMLAGGIAGPVTAAIDGGGLVTTTADIEAVWRRFCDGIYETGRRVLALAPNTSPASAAEALQFATRSLRLALDFRLDGYDPRHPHLIWVDRTSAAAIPLAPNVDNSYIFARLDGRETYRLSITTDTIDELNLSVHAGHYAEDAFVQQWGNVTLKELKPVNGRLEVILSATRHEGNWLQIGEQAKFMFLRIYYFDWQKGRPPAVSLTCLSANAPQPNSIPPEDLVAGLAETITWMRTQIENEQAFAKKFIARAGGKKNAFFAAQNETGAPQAYRYAGAEFELAPDEALVVEFRPPRGRYWIVQWHRLPWGDSADFFNHITSVNNHQAHVDSDGLVRLVFAAQDPGVQNWLSTEGRRNGLIYARWFWSDDPQTPQPVSRVVPVGEVRSRLPADTPSFGPEQRARQLDIRRHHLRLRY